MDGDASAGRHTSLLLDQLNDERTKKESLEQRGIAVISTSGTLVAITFGFVSLAIAQTHSLRHATVLLLVVALAGLVAASTAGLTINLPARIPIIDAAQLADIAERVDWDFTSQESVREEYRIRAKLLIGLRKVNQARARILIIALSLEVLSLVLMSISVALALRQQL